MKKIWHKTSDNDYPQATGEYAKKSYPQIPCLCVDKFKFTQVLMFNVTEDCWDDSEGAAYSVRLKTKDL